MDEGEPKVMWLSGLHIPESYLTALVQAACRKNGWPLDLSTLYTQVTQYRSEDEVSNRPGQGNKMLLPMCSMICDELQRLTVFFSSGCYVSGLYLEGADWDVEKGCLVRSKPKGLVVELPILKVIPTEARRLRLQVWTTATTVFCTILQFTVLFLLTCVFFFFFFEPQNTLRTPVYTTSLRRNAMGVGLVFEADLSTTMHYSHWVLQGVCLCLNAD